MDNISTIDLLVPSVSKIQEAEKLRTEGLYREAFVLVQGVLSIRGYQISELDELQQRRFLSALRICFGSIFSLTKSEINPFSFKAGLFKTREILTVYEYEVVRSMADHTIVGIMDEPYDFAGEMARDISRYLAFVMELRGFGGLSLARHQRVLAQKAKEPSLKALMTFEAASTDYEYHSSTANLGVLFQSAQDAIAACMQAKKYERAATIAARFYAYISIGSFAEFATDAFDKALGADHTVISIWERETRKPIKKRLAKHFRRLLFRFWPMDWRSLTVVMI